MWIRKSFFSFRKFLQITTTIRRHHQYLNGSSPMLTKMSGTDGDANGISLKNFLAEVEKKIPLKLASEWDNVGLLIEPYDNFVVRKILVTNDLTEPVMDEAIDRKANLIISYHPPIFRPFKRITQNDWKERIVAKCLTNNIALYSPHTALDAIEGGINDWLLKIIDCTNNSPIENSSSIPGNVPEYCINVVRNFGNDVESFKSLQSGYCINCDAKNLPSVLERITNTTPDAEIVSVTKTPKVSHTREGMGRLGELSNPIKIREIVDCLKNSLGLEKLRLALSKHHSTETLIKTVAVCAGSGASILKQAKAEFFITGEMSHHELLDATHRGISVVLCEHSNTERGYLQTTLVKYLQENFSGIMIEFAVADRDPIQIV